jgi:hypothetical protein
MPRIARAKQVVRQNTLKRNGSDMSEVSVPLLARIAAKQKGLHPYNKFPGWYTEIDNNKDKGKVVAVRVID